MKKSLSLFIMGAALVLIIPGLTFAMPLQDLSGQGFTAYEVYMLDGGNPTSTIGAYVWAKVEEMYDSGSIYYKYSYSIDNTAFGDSIKVFDLTLYGPYPDAASSYSDTDLFKPFDANGDIFLTDNTTYYIPADPTDPDDFPFLHLVFNDAIDEEHSSAIFCVFSVFPGLDGNQVDPSLLADTTLQGESNVLTGAMGGTIGYGTVATPEPGTLLLIGTGMLGLAITRRLRSRKKC